MRKNIACIALLALVLLANAQQTFEQQLAGASAEWKGTALLASTVVVILVSLIYVLGTPFVNPQQKAWLHSEMWQSIFSLVIIVLIIAFASIFDSVFQLSTGELGMGSCTGNHVQCTIDWLHKARCSAAVAAGDAVNQGIQAMKASTVEKGWQMDNFPWFGMTWRKNAGRSMDYDRFSLMLESLTKSAGALAGQEAFLQIVANPSPSGKPGLFVTLIIFGVVLRAFFLTRQVGGLMMAIGLGLFFVYPTLVVGTAGTVEYFLKGASASCGTDGSACTAGTDCCSGNCASGTCAVAGISDQELIQNCIDNMNKQVCGAGADPTTCLDPTTLGMDIPTYCTQIVSDTSSAPETPEGIAPGMGQGSNYDPSTCIVTPTAPDSQRDDNIATCQNMPKPANCADAPDVGCTWANDCCCPLGLACVGDTGWPYYQCVKWGCNAAELRGTKADCIAQTKSQFSQYEGNAANVADPDRNCKPRCAGTYGGDDLGLYYSATPPSCKYQASGNACWYSVDDGVGGFYCQQAPGWMTAAQRAQWTPSPDQRWSLACGGSQSCPPLNWLAKSSFSSEAECRGNFNSAPAQSAYDQICLTLNAINPNEPAPNQHVDKDACLAFGGSPCNRIPYPSVAPADPLPAGYAFRNSAECEARKSGDTSDVERTSEEACEKLEEQLGPNPPVPKLEPLIVPPGCPETLGSVSGASEDTAGILFAISSVLPIFNILITISFIRTFSPLLGGDVELTGVARLI